MVRCGPSAGTGTAAGRATAPGPCEGGTAMNASPNSTINFDLLASEQRVPDEVRAHLLESPGFGQVFTDHMISLRYSAGQGWHDGKLEPYGPLVLDPATAVLHYSQEIFEGLKAYRQDGGPIVAFRPHANAARFRRSAARMAMPELPDDAFVQAIELLVSHDRDWVPANPEHSLYLRPFMIATTAALGDHDSAADGLAAARHYQGLPADAGPRPGDTGERGDDLGGTVAIRLRVRRDHGGVRVRHRGRDHASRRGEGCDGQLDDRRRSAGPGRDAAARAAARHPVRPAARPVRLGAQDRLTETTPSLTSPYSERSNRPVGP